MNRTKYSEIDYYFNKCVGEVIKAKRLELGIAIQDLAKKVGITRQTLYRYENNESRLKQDMFVFSMKQGYLPIRETTISKYNNKYAKLANLKHIRIHDFRHSCASLLINKGASIVLVSKYLGHSKVSMTLDTYSHLYKSELLDITNEINNIIKE